MRVVLFCHSLLSDWNHGNAHFLRGITRELQQRGHAVEVLEPCDGWSLAHLRRDTGDAALALFRSFYPTLDSRLYDIETLDLDATLDGADLVLVHEWTDLRVIARLVRHRRAGGRYRLLYHDTHHRSVTAPETMPADLLAQFDGALVFGEAIRRLYLERGWTHHVWTWHEAADTEVFRPLPAAREGDLVWIGNWGDEERTRELEEFLLEPVRALGLTALVHGVRYPAEARARLAASGITYKGYLPNPCAPQVFARHRVTVHVPRRPYAAALPGIPTIRVFEALACGIPMVSAPWDDMEGLFTAGEDFLFARDGVQMQKTLRMLLHEPDYAAALATHGRRTVLARHSCSHRVEELLGICRELGIATTASGEASACAAD